MDWCVQHHHHQNMCQRHCLFGRVLAPSPSTLCPFSPHQPCATFHVQLLLAPAESHMLYQASQKHLALLERPEMGCIKGWLRYCLGPKQNFRLRRGSDYGQHLLNSASRLVLLQCSGFAHAKTIGRLHGRCQQVRFSNGLKEWPVNCRVWSKILGTLA
jgi:hypothetical protein